MQMGVGFGTLSRQGQLRLPVTFVYNEIVARDLPIYWAVAADGAAAGLSCHPEVISDTLDAAVSGVTIPDRDLCVAVPAGVIDEVPHLARGTEVVFVLTDDLAREGGILVVPRAGLDAFDADLARAVPP